jgi:phosphonate transport system ATP-binding protein
MVAYGAHRALEPIDLSLAAGEAVAVVGSSGAGKTTLLRLLGAALSPTAGSVLIDGVEAEQLSPSANRRLRAQVGFVHQDHQLVPNYRVIQNVLTGRVGQQGLFASIRSVLWPSKAEEQEVYALLDRVGLADKLFSWTSALSVGERQRVAIARALYQRPRLLLADEPIASVDPIRGRELIDLLLRLGREEGWTLVVSLHQPEVARSCFPRIIGLRKGHLVFDGRATAFSASIFDGLYALPGGGSA